MTAVATTLYAKLKSQLRKPVANNRLRRSKGERHHPGLCRVEYVYCDAWSRASGSYGKL